MCIHLFLFKIIFMYARYSLVVVSQLLRWRQRSDSHTPNTQDIRSKCYISLITSSSFTRYGLAWSIKFELWCHIFTIFYKYDHWFPPMYWFSYRKHQTTCHVPLLAKWLNELISVWKLIINFPSICYKYFFPWKYKANSSPHWNIVNVTSTKICSWSVASIHKHTVKDLLNFDLYPNQVFAFNHLLFFWSWSAACWFPVNITPLFLFCAPRGKLYISCHMCNKCL